jgi:hypothetical protein
LAQCKKKKENQTVTHKSLYSALAAAQAEMGPALKDAVNPAFKSKYADLAAVLAAVLPSLNKHGIAMIQPTYDDETGRYVKTVLVHGETGETLEWRVPLIIVKNDMQGYGGAVTYARRYGAMCVGIAPEDDDGNAAAKAAPKRISSAEMKRQIENIRNDLMDCYSVVGLENLWPQVKRQMDKDGWPTHIEGDEEQTHRAMVINMFADRKKELLAVMVEAPEPNILMAGE